MWPPLAAMYAWQRRWPLRDDSQTDPVFANLLCISNCVSVNIKLLAISFCLTPTVCIPTTIDLKWFDKLGILMNKQLSKLS